MWKMSIRSNARWNGQAACLRHSGPGPHGAVSYLSICSVLRGEERGFADQRGLTPSWGMGIIIGLRLPLAMEPIRHFSSPDSPSPVVCSWEDEVKLCFSGPEQEQPQTGRPTCDCSDIYLIRERSLFPTSTLHCILLLLLPSASRVRRTRVTIDCLEHWELLESILYLLMSLN